MIRRAFATILVGALVAGCNTGGGHPTTGADPAFLAPVTMRLHPVFTQVKDWTNDGRPDGIEVLVELQDQFGDPTKASGKVIFELFEYRRYDPEPRGQRLANPWIGDLSTVDLQREHWNRTSRTYSFQLALDQIRADKGYVLTATFELSQGGRFFDRIILEPRETRRATAPPTTSAGR